MSKKVPVVYLTYANEQGVPASYLSQLLREETEIYGKLRALHHKGHIEVLQKSNATSDDIFTEVAALRNYNKELHLFHYGGHANGSHLLLEDGKGGNRSANAEGLSSLLGRQPQLKLVFLNGCSTRDQVKSLMACKVPAVIATSTSINDEMAVRFAEHFYKLMGLHYSVREAFEESKALLLTDYDFRSGGIVNTRALTWEEPEFAAGKIEIPWGLYINDQADFALDWRFPEMPSMENGANKYFFKDLDKYTCDRVKQQEAFEAEFYDCLDQTTQQFYFIKGKSEDSPSSLSKRFYMETIKSSAVDQRQPEVFLSLEFKGLPIEKNKRALIRDLSKFFRIDPDSNTTLRSLLNTPFGKYRYVVVEARIDGANWNDETVQLLGWFINEYCDDLKTSEVDFVFFFNITYKEEPVWKRLFKGTIQSRINADIEKLKKASEKVCVNLADLEPIETEDIKRWLAKKYENEIQKDAEARRMMGGKDKLNMAEAELKITEFVEQEIKTYEKKHGL